MAKETAQSLGAYMKERKKNAPKVIRSVEAERGSNGGVTFTHRFQNNGGNFYHDSETAPYGPGQDHEVVKHFIKHMGLKMGKGKAAIEDGAD